MLILRNLVASLLLLALSPPAVPTLRIEAPPALSGAAARLQAIDPARLAVAMRLTGLSQPGLPIRVLLAPEGSAPAQGVPPWISGYALPERDTVVLLPARAPAYPNLPAAAGSAWRPCTGRKRRGEARFPVGDAESPTQDGHRHAI